MLVAAAVMWGMSFAVTKAVLDEVSPAKLLALRYSIAAVVLLPIVIKRRDTVSKVSAARGMAIGFMSGFAYVFQNVGLKYTTASKSAFLTMVYCVLTPFVFWVIAQKKPSGYDCGAAIVCMIGIGFISLNGNLTISGGDTLTLMSGVIYAIQIVLIGHSCGKDDPFCLTFFMVFASGIFSWIYKFIAEGPSVSMPVRGWLVMFYLSIFCTVIAFVFQNWAQKQVSPSETALLVSLESVFGVLGSILLLHEAMSPRLVLGFALVFWAIVMSQAHVSLIGKLPWGRIRAVFRK